MPPIGGQKDVATADWIQSGHIYEFPLYDSDRSGLRDKISVTTATE
jgi:hypothetical protein